MTRQNLLVGLILVLGIAGLSYWFLENFELREEEIPVGYKGEARSNPFFAARIFLREMGIEAERIDMPDLNRELPLDNATLIITTLRGTMDDKKSQRLFNWVESGGHLLVRSAEPEFYDPDEDEVPLPPKDPLLEMFRITPVYSTHSDLEWDDSINFDLVTSANKVRELNIAFPPRQFLEGELNNDLTVSNLLGTHVIHRKVGRGAITVMSDMDFLRNYSIGEEDHAEAFWIMLNWHNDRGGKILILHNDDMPALITLLWRHLLPVVIVAGLMLFFWLAKGFFRFGPLLPQPQARRRSLMEHIEASGRFFWQDKQQHRLIQQTRLALQKKLIRIHPGWIDLNEQEREQHLAELIQMPIDSVRRLLHGTETYQTQDFTRVIQQLETIRKQL